MALTADNMAYTAVDAVFQGLTVQQGLDFASILPSVLRAFFVKDWDVSHPPVAFFKRDLRVLPPEARDFWHVDVDDPSELDQRIV